MLFANQKFISSTQMVRSIPLSQIECLALLIFISSAVLNAQNLNGIIELLPQASLNECGNQNIIQDAIIDGETNLQGYPWIVSLRISYGSSILSSHFCAGNLITKSYVITAAHCLYGRKASQLAVIVGTSDIKDPPTTSNTYYASLILKHEAYDPVTLSNDIGIIKLDREVTFSSKVSPICLPRYDDIGMNNALVAGW